MVEAYPELTGVDEAIEELATALDEEFIEETLVGTALEAKALELTPTDETSAELVCAAALDELVNTALDATLEAASDVLGIPLEKAPTELVWRALDDVLVNAPAELAAELEAPVIRGPTELETPEDETTMLLVGKTLEELLENEALVVMTAGKDVPLLTADERPEEREKVALVDDPMEATVDDTDKAELVEEKGKHW